LYIYLSFDFPPPPPKKNSRTKIGMKHFGDRRRWALNEWNMMCLCYVLTEASGCCGRLCIRILEAHEGGAFPDQLGNKDGLCFSEVVNARSTANMLHPGFEPNCSAFKRPYTH
jgi:hypothetical protein